MTQNILPDAANETSALGLTLQQAAEHCRSGRLADAARLCEAALADEPGNCAALELLGRVRAQQGNLPEAVRLLRETLQQRPDAVAVRYNLGCLLHALRQYADACSQFEAVLTRRPDFAEAHNSLALTLQSLGRYEPALAHYRQALALKPDFADAHANLGGAQESLGQLAEARQSFAAAIAIAPRRGRFYRHLSECKTFTSEDPSFKAMEELARDPAPLETDDRLNLHFALGKAFADIGRHDRAFEHLAAGNALKRQSIVYDEASKQALVERIRAVFTPELMRAKQGLGDPSEIPVFIVGMPRSGSTLVEQILASHPDVFGAGEINDFDLVVTGLRRRDGAPTAYPENAVDLDGPVLRGIGARYLERIRRPANSSQRITDKMIANWFAVGLIHLAFPKARIIHMRRYPLDTCFSCFSKLFADTLGWSYDLAELGRYYRLYATLMEHWRSILPGGTMLEVNYEDVVADLEGQTRRVLTYCGLPWNDACLAFHRTQRPIRTASAAQVRQPLYHSAVGRWRPYAATLQPLIDALGPALTKIPAQPGRPLDAKDRRAESAPVSAEATATGP